MPALVCFFTLVNNLLLVGRAHGRLAVGEKDDDERAPTSSPGLQATARGFNASSMAVPPIGLRSLMKLFGLLAIRLGRIHELVEERLDFGGEADDFEAVLVVQILDAELQRFLGLLQFLPAIEPEVSSTNATSLGTTVFLSRPRPGEASSRK